MRIASPDSTGALADLDDLAARTRHGGGEGVPTSDEILEAGRRGLRFFDAFLPRYQAWTGTELGGGMRGITATYGELASIRFDRLRADAAKLTQVHDDLVGHGDELATSVGAARESWDGAAATAADEHGTRLLGDGQTVADTVANASALISMGTDRAESAVLTRARMVLSLDSGNVGGLTPRQVDDVISAARGAAPPLELFAMAVLPAFAPMLDNHIVGDVKSFLGTGNRATGWMSQRAKQWLDGVFVPTVEAQYRAFVQYCKITKQDVADSWSGMSDGIGGLYPDPDEPQRPGAGSVTPTPSAPAPTPPSGAATAPVDQQAPGVFPPPGQQSTAPSSNLPPGSAPAASPAAPGEAMLAQAPGDAQPDQSVGRAGDGLTLTKPDALGHAQLTVTRPDGSTANYTLDLGPQDGTGADQMRADADGTAVIHDGAMTITVHRAADGGPVTVTVDAGGPAQTYTVDFGAGPAAAGDPVLAGQDRAGSAGASSSAAPAMAVGDTAPALPAGGDTSADGVVGSGLSHAPAAAAPSTPGQPSHYTAIGSNADQGAASAGPAAAGRSGGPGGGGTPFMPMMGGMGGGAGQDKERQGGRWNTSADFFSEDTSQYERIADMLEPEPPE